jgi:hypothetical protein
VTTQTVPDISDLVSRAQANVAEFNLKQREQEERERADSDATYMRAIGDSLIEFFGEDDGNVLFHSLGVTIAVRGDIGEFRDAYALFTYASREFAVIFTEGYNRKAVDLIDVQTKRRAQCNRMSSEDEPSTVDNFLSILAGFAGDVSKASPQPEAQPCAGPWRVVTDVSAGKLADALNRLDAEKYFIMRIQFEPGEGGAGYGGDYTIIARPRRMDQSSNGSVGNTLANGKE